MKAFLALGAVMVLLGAGCATTERQTAEQAPVICGFLGADLCAELQPGAKGEAGLRYVNPKGTFTQYDKVMIVMVSFFGSDPGKTKPQDEQRLTDLFYKNLHDALAKRYPVVDEAGPGVMKVEVVLLDAEAATPGVRSLTDSGPPVARAQCRLRPRRGNIPVRGRRSGRRQDLGLGDWRPRDSPWIAGPGVALSRPLCSGGGEMPRTRSGPGTRSSPTACMHTPRAQGSHDVRRPLSARWPGLDGHHTDIGPANRPDAWP